MATKTIAHMIPIYPDLEWYASVSEKKGLTARCPHATVHRCPRYFESLSLLSDQGITTKMPSALHDEVIKKWQAHELWPVTDETAASISGGKKPNCFSNFCPEVAFDTFKLFASTVIQFYDELDRENRERFMAKEDTRGKMDWRWNWEHVAPMHYSECPLYSKISKEKAVTQVTFNGPVSGQINVAGESVNSPVLSLSVGDILAKIDASDATSAEKTAAKSKLQEFLAHPVVTAIVGGLAGRIGG